VRTHKKGQVDSRKCNTKVNSRNYITRDKLCRHNLSATHIFTFRCVCFAPNAFRLLNIYIYIYLHQIFAKGISRTSKEEGAWGCRRLYNDEMGGTCSTHRRDENCVQDFGRKTWRYYSEDLGVDGEILLEWILEIWREVVDWIYAVQDMDQWRAVVSTVMNLRVPLKVWNFLTRWVTVSFSRRTLERELRMVQLSATSCSCIAILWVSLVSFAAITLCLASQRVFIFVSVYFVIDSVRKLLVTPSYVPWSLGPKKSSDEDQSCSVPFNWTGWLRSCGPFAVR
jgi:hypothetical protein